METWAAPTVAVTVTVPLSWAPAAGTIARTIRSARTSETACRTRRTWSCASIGVLLIRSLCWRAPDAHRVGPDSDRWIWTLHPLSRWSPRRRYERRPDEATDLGHGHRMRPA